MTMSRTFGMMGGWAGPCFDLSDSGLGPWLSRDLEQSSVQLDAL